VLAIVVCRQMSKEQTFDQHSLSGHKQAFSLADRARRAAAWPDKAARARPELEADREFIYDLIRRFGGEV